MRSAAAPGGVMPQCEVCGEVLKVGDKFVATARGVDQYGNDQLVEMAHMDCVIDDLIRSALT